MKTVLGPFHPYLETALVAEIRRHKTENALLPVLLLVPSDSLRRRLKILLTREQNLSLVNLQLLTFHQLSLRLFSETNAAQALALDDDLFLEEALRQIIRTGQPGTHVFAGIEERAGGCAALWQTLRDLRDGLVDPAIALEALREGHFAQRTNQRTSELLALLQTVLTLLRGEKYSGSLRSRQNRNEAEYLSRNFLKQFRQILYYGFYDLTQIQLDFFHAVSQHYPTTLFFPLLSTRPTSRRLEFRRTLLPTLPAGPDRQQRYHGRISLTNPVEKMACL